MLITPREAPTKDLEERVVVGPEESGEALLDLDRQALLVIRPVDGPADALVEGRERLPVKRSTSAGRRRRLCGNSLAWRRVLPV